MCKLTKKSRSCINLLGIYLNKQYRENHFDVLSLMTIQILAAFLSHGIFFLDFETFLKPTKTTVTSTRLKQKNVLVGKTLLVLNPCMVPYVYWQPEHASVCVCSCGLRVYLHTSRLCVLYLHISVHSCCIYVRKDSQACVFVLGMCVLDAVGEQGGAKRP